MLVYAGLGATKRGVIGPEGAVALLVAASLAPLAAAGSPEYVALAAALAIAVGCVFVVARLLRLGWLADYFSQSVLVGYISGVTISIMLQSGEPPLVSYTGKGRANGVCQVNAATAAATVSCSSRPRACP